jgi:hypothetical protein
MYFLKALDQTPYELNIMFDLVILLGETAHEVSLNTFDPQ